MVPPVGGVVLISPPRPSSVHLGFMMLTFLPVKTPSSCFVECFVFCADYSLKESRTFTACTYPCFICIVEASDDSSFFCLSLAGLNSLSGGFPLVGCPSLGSSWMDEGNLFPRSVLHPLRFDAVVQYLLDCAYHLMIPGGTWEVALP